MRGPVPDKPTDRPTVPQAIAAIRAYYALPGNEVTGGNLHIVVDDKNLDDGSLVHCRERALERGDTEGIALADLLLLLTRTQRKKAVTEA